MVRVFSLYSGNDNKMNIQLICKECRQPVFFNQVIGDWTHEDGSRVCKGKVTPYEPPRQYISISDVDS